MKRFSRAMVLLVVFGSVWMHGLLPVAASAHDMMSDMGTPSCLSHCLATIHADSVHNITIPSAVSFVVPESPASPRLKPGATSVSPFSTFSTSHHDPGLVLKTIKRE